MDPEAESFYSLTPYNSMGNNPIVHIDPNGDAFFIIPQFGVGKNGPTVGVEVGIGIPGALSLSATVGTSLGFDPQFYWSVQGSAAGFYAGYGSQGGFAGFGYQYGGLSGGVSYNKGGWSAGLSYGASNNGFGGSFGVSYGKGGLGWTASGAYTYVYVPPASVSQSPGATKGGTQSEGFSELNFYYNTWPEEAPYEYNPGPNEVANWIGTYDDRVTKFHIRKLRRPGDLMAVDNWDLISTFNYANQNSWVANPQHWDKAFIAGIATRIVTGRGWLVAGGAAGQWATFQLSAVHQQWKFYYGYD